MVQERVVTGFMIARIKRNKQKSRNIPVPAWAMVFLAALLLGAIWARVAVAETDRPLVVGTLPVIQCLPLFVADELGLYKSQGVQIQLAPFRTAMDKDVAMTTGQLDGYFGDLFTPIVLSAGGVDVRMVARNYLTGQGGRMFGILVGPESELKTLAGLAEKPVAVSSNTIIDYVTSTLLVDGGVAPDSIRRLEIKNIPLRFQMLMKGQVDAATLPEPLVTLAEKQGCRLLADDGRTGLSSTVLVFSSEALRNQREGVNGFLKALDQAAAIINEKPESVRDIMNRYCNVPQPLRNTYPVPVFPPLVVPEAEKVDAAVSWLYDRGAIKAKPKYSELVDAGYVP